MVFWHPFSGQAGCSGTFCPSYFSIAHFRRFSNPFAYFLQKSFSGGRIPRTKMRRGMMPLMRCRRDLCRNFCRRGRGFLQDRVLSVSCRFDAAWQTIQGYSSLCPTAGTQAMPQYIRCKGDLLGGTTQKGAPESVRSPMRRCCGKAVGFPLCGGHCRGAIVPMARDSVVSASNSRT